MSGEGDAAMLRRVETLEREVKKLNAVKNMGRGVLWVGGVALAVAGLVIGTWRLVVSGA